MTAFLLVHSPIVGPNTWEPVATELRSRGHAVVVPDLPVEVSGEYWAAHTTAIGDAAETAFPAGTPVTVAAHSGAGQLLAPAAAALRQRDLSAGAYLLVDAGLPTRGASRLEQLRAESPGFADELEAVFAAGGRFPDWPGELLAGLVPDDERRARLSAGVRQLPLEYWTERIPDNPTWPDAPCGVLLFSAGYEPTAAAAEHAGWPLRRLDVANHFFLLVNPAAVADELLALHQALLRRSIMDSAQPRRPTRPGNGYARGLGGASFSSVASSRVKSSGDVNPL